MKLATLRRGRHGVSLPGTIGVARLDRSTKRLTERLAPGEIAVLDHVDLDRASADALVACRVAAVVNAAPSTSGRYPNLGPQILIAADIPLLDRVGSDVFARVEEGDVVRVHEDGLYAGEQLLVAGSRQDGHTVEAAQAQARAGLVTHLEAFAANTMEYLLAEADLLLDGVGVPRIRTRLAGRHVVVVTAGYQRQDLASLRGYIREYRPLLLGVDGGADALRAAGLVPDLIVGELSAVSDAALRCGAEVIVRADRDGRAAGLARVQDLGVPAVVFPASGTSEDVALLLAHDNGAALIVAAGSHATLVEFLDQGAPAMASSVLTRLRVGGTLVDAKAISQLYRRRISAWTMIVLLLAALTVMAAAVALSMTGEPYGQILSSWWSRLAAAWPGST